MTQPQPLTFEEFSKRDFSGIPRYNDIILYFMENDLGQIMRDSPAFQRFQTENPGLEGRLREVISPIHLSSPQISEELKPHDKDLYRFYLIMRNYNVPDEGLIGGL